MYDKKQSLIETAKKRVGKSYLTNLKQMNNFYQKEYAQLKKQNCYICGNKGSRVQLQYCIICGKPICPNCGVVVDFNAMHFSCTECDKTAFKNTHPEATYKPIIKEVRHLPNSIKRELIRNGVHKKTKVSLSPSRFSNI